MKTKNVLITGASSGIGYEFAKLFARKGFNLILVARSTEILNNLKVDLEKEYGIKVKIIIKDLARMEASEEIYKELKEANVQVEILINNAGLGTSGLFYENNWECEKNITCVNILALTHMTKLFVQDMAERGSGKILNVSSIAAFQPGPLMAVYYASKAYVQSFSEAISKELHGTGVSVTALCPGPTVSEFQKTAGIHDSRLMKLLRFSSSEEFAMYGIKSLMIRKTVAIQGIINKFFVFMVRMLPNKLISTIVMKLHRKW